MASIDRRDQFELLKNSSDVGRQLCRHVKGPISIRCTIELVTIFLILMTCIICE